MRTPEPLTALVTGATDGVGHEVALRLAQLGATVLVHGRDDLSRLAEVDALADEVLGTLDELDLVVSDAGVGFGPPTGRREVSPDGHQLRWAVNHLAPHHLLRRLASLLRRSAPARVVAVTSVGQAALELDDREVGFFSGSYPDDEALHDRVGDAHVRAELRRRTEETVTATLAGPDVPRPRVTQRELSPTR